MDWIQAHFDCSLIGAWLVLTERLKKDVERWQQLKNNGYAQITEDPNNTLVISIGKEKHGPWVSLKLADHAIILKTEGPNSSNPQVEARLIPTLNTKGECRLSQDGNELEFWEVSRFILEPLLF